MKTIFVKKGSEKNIEMFKMSNEELVNVQGGGFAWGYDENGNKIIIIRPGVANVIAQFHSRF